MKTCKIPTPGSPLEGAEYPLTFQMNAQDPERLSVGK